MHPHEKKSSICQKFHTRKLAKGPVLQDVCVNLAKGLFSQDVCVNVAKSEIKLTVTFYNQNRHIIEEFHGKNLLQPVIK